MDRYKKFGKRKFYGNKYKKPDNRQNDVNSVNNNKSGAEGTSGGMEAQGTVKIFHRSVDTRRVKYVRYLGDGDSKGFNTVVASKPYFDGTVIEKLGCIGHVQKRMGT